MKPYKCKSEHFEQDFWYGLVVQQNTYKMSSDLFIFNCSHDLQGVFRN